MATTALLNPAYLSNAPTSCGSVLCLWGGRWSVLGTEVHKVPGSGIWVSEKTLLLGSW
jgi:hypothetical protein